MARYTPASVLRGAGSHTRHVPALRGSIRLTTTSLVQVTRRLMTISCPGASGPAILPMISTWPLRCDILEMRIRRWSLSFSDRSPSRTAW